MSTPIYFDSTETGAPQFNNVPGSRLSVLRSILINGFNVVGITQIEVASGVATVTAPSHGYSSTFGKQIKITGAPVPALNGNKAASNVLTNTFTYPAPSVADGVYTGTMDARRGHGGYEEEFTGTNKAVFKRTAPEALLQKLRIDDSDNSFMRLRSVETATGIDTYTGPTPTEAMVAGGARWQCGNNNTTNKKWVAVVDDHGFWFCTQLGTADQFVPYFWGDGIPYYPSDAYFTILTGQTTTVISTTPGFGLGSPVSYFTAGAANHTIYVSRGVLVGSTGGEYMAHAGSNTQFGHGNSNLQSTSTFANVAIAPVFHLVGQAKEVRGEVPGLASPLAAVPFSALQVVTSGARNYLAIPFNNTGSVGQLLLSLTDWGY